MFASLTVVTHPKRRLVSALLRARRLARAAAARPDITFARALQTGTFRSDTLPPYVPARVAVMLWGREADALDEVDARVMAPLADGAAQRWRVLLRPASVHGAWAGFCPNEVDADDRHNAKSLRAEEPVVVLIHGVLRARYLVKFTRDSAEVGKQLARTAGYLGGLALSDTPLTTASFSCWRSVQDSRAFAFAAGTHRDAYKVDRAEHRHATEFFVRFRPLYSEGTFEGRDPLAGVLDRNATGRDLAPPDSGAGEWRAARATSRTGESSHEDATR
jgi:hypothetical protein